MKNLFMQFVLANDNIKDGDTISGKTFFLNKEALLLKEFKHQKNDVLIEFCNFFGGNQSLKGDMKKQFDLMMWRGDLFMEYNP